jgi:thiamine biosynthesis lipoprotein
MGMPVRLVVHAATDEAARAAARAAFDRVAALDAVMSDHRPDSEVAQLAATSGAWVSVSRDLFAVLTRAREIAAATGGAFDPTVGPLVALWREARATRRLPSASALADARTRVGWRLVDLDPARQAVRLARPGMRLDLGGIAKGYILQEALAVLRARGMPRALVQGGGDIVAGDPPPAQGGWRVEAPGADAAFAARAGTLANAALATSGPTFQFVEIDAVRYSHVIDPRTGLAVTSPRVVHVIAGDGTTADAVATALSVLGDDASAMMPALRRLLGELHVSLGR